MVHGLPVCEPGFGRFRFGRTGLLCAVPFVGGGGGVLKINYVGVGALHAYAQAISCRQDLALCVNRQQRVEGVKTRKHGWILQPPICALAYKPRS